MTDQKFETELENKIYNFLNGGYKEDKDEDDDDSDNFYTKTYRNNSEWVIYQEHPNVRDSILRILCLRYYEFNFTFMNHKLCMIIKYSSSQKPPSYYLVLNVINDLKIPVKITNIEDVKYISDAPPQNISTIIELIGEFGKYNCTVKYIEVYGYPTNKRECEIPATNLTCEKISLVLPLPLKLFEPEINFIKRINGTVRLIYCYGDPSEFSNENLNDICSLPNIEFMYTQKLQDNSLHSCAYLLDKHRDKMNLRRLITRYHNSANSRHPLLNKDLKDLIESYLYDK